MKARLKIDVKNYITEIENEIIEEINKSNGVYLISGCGTGKTHFVKNILCKKKNTLVINFLNVVNEQSYKDIYIDGRNVRYYNGEKSKAINVQQIENKIFTDNDEVLKKIEIVVIDEIQLQHLSCNFRPICGLRLKEFIDKCIKLGIKILLITGTPIAPLDEVFGLSKIKVTKTDLEEKDKYTFTLMKGLCPSNCIGFVKRLIEEGKTVILKTDKYTKRVETLAKKENLRTARIYSDANKVDVETPTKYIIKNQVLPDEYDLFITTKVLVEGVNLLEDNDREVVIVSFVDDIESPMSAIQLASRLRKQHKNLILGYTKEEDFDLTKTYSGYNSILKDPIFTDREKYLARFTNKDVWKSYIENCVPSEIIESETIEKKEKIEDDDKLPISLNELTATLIGKLREIDKEWMCKEKPFSKYFRVRSTDKDIVEIAESGEGYYYLYVPSSKGLVKSLLRLMNSKIIDVTKLDDDEIIDIIEVENTYFTLADSTKNNDAILKDYAKGIKGDCFSTMLAEALKTNVRAIKGGEDVPLTKRMENKHIFSHLIILENFPETIKRLAKLNNPFTDSSEPIEDIFKKERLNYLNSLSTKSKNLINTKENAGKIGGKIGGKATKSITLINNSLGFSMTFSSSKDCDSYVVAKLGFTKREKERLRNSEVKGYRRA